MGVGGHQAPAPLTLGKKPGTHCIQAGRAPQLVWKVAESLIFPPGFYPRHVQPVTSHYNDYAILTI